LLSALAVWHGAPQARLRAPRRGSRPSFFKTFRPERAWGMPGAQCARSRAWCVENTRVSHHGRTGITRHSRTRMVLTVSFVLSPVTGLVCHRRRRSCLHRLDASVGASGPHDFTVRKHAPSSLAPPASTASHPNVRDDRDTPLKRNGMAESIKPFLPNGEAKYFLRTHWTRHRPDRPSGKSIRRMGGANGPRERAPDDKLRDTHRVTLPG
jgi:hypothetical protein